MPSARSRDHAPGVIRIFVADDHAIVRRGIADLAAETADLVVAGEAPDGRAALNALEEGGFDVLVLDLSLPRVNGTEVLRRARALRPTLPIVVFSMYPEEQYAERLAADGAAAYLSKTQPVSDLLDAIRAVAAGGRYVRKDPDAVVMDRPRERAGAAPHQTLTRRELQIFMLLTQGESVSEIAAQLDLTTSTVSTHVGAIKTKLGARSVADIVRYAVREGLVET